MEVGKEEGGFQGVGNIGFARLTVLAVVTFIGVGVGPPNGVSRLFGQVGDYPVYKSLNGFGSSYPKFVTPYININTRELQRLGMHRILRKF